MPRIRFTNLFAERIGGVNSVEVQGATVESSLRALTHRGFARREDRTFKYA